MSKGNKSKISNIKKVPNKKKKTNSSKIAISIGTAAIFVLVVASFVFAPLMTTAASKPEELVFGSYGNSKITNTPGNYFNRTIINLKNQYRDNQSSLGSGNYGIFKSAFNQTVIQKAIEEKVLDSGFIITDKQIDKEMVENGPFNVNGEFSEKKYQDSSSQYRFNLRKAFRENLIKKRYEQDTIYSIHKNSNLVDFIADIGSEEKSFNYSIFKMDNIKDSFFSEYFNSNTDKFRKIPLNKITIRSNENEANDILSKINNNEISFEEAAKEFSKDSYSSEGGKLGSVYFHELVKTFQADLDTEVLAESANIAENIFKLNVSELSEIIETKYGWVIYQAKENASISDLSSDNIINDIKTYMSSSEKGIIEDHLLALGDSYIDSIKDSDFKSAAIQLNIENGATDYFSINYGNNRLLLSNISTATQQNPVFASAAYDELFLEGLFSLNTPDEISKPLILEDNIVVAQLIDKKKSDKITEEQIEYYKSYIKSNLTDYINEDMVILVRNSPEFIDNFDTTYSKIFSGS
ncbi:MAG: hypothetical protein GY756_03515 [bacterium]|nr:hypothetical protein [bacterium]